MGDVTIAALKTKNSATKCTNLRHKNSPNCCLITGTYIIRPSWGDLKIRAKLKYYLNEIQFFH